MEVLTAFFALLFVTQTVLFIYLYKRALTQRDVTPKSQKTSQDTATKDITIPALDIQSSQNNQEERIVLHSSAMAALRLIKEKGSVISSDVSRSLNLSREHTARIMKSLYLKGLVTRSGKPFRYSLTEKGLALLESSESR